jgi:tryptophan synthase beta chain
VLAETEGILPALEPAHALAHVLRSGSDGGMVVVGLSGRGDKDVPAVADLGK